MVSTPAPAMAPWEVSKPSETGEERKSPKSLPKRLESKSIEREDGELGERVSRAKAKWGTEAKRQIGDWGLAETNWKKEEPRNVLISQGTHNCKKTLTINRSWFDFQSTQSNPGSNRRSKLTKNWTEDRVEIPQFGPVHLGLQTDPILDRLINNPNFTYILPFST